MYIKHYIMYINVYILNIGKNFILKLKNNIKRCRFDHNYLSQKDLADALGITRQTIIAIEKGKFNPATMLALRLAKFFNTNVENIFYLDDE